MKRSTKSKELAMEIAVGSFVFAALLSLSFFTIILSGEAIFRPKHIFEVKFDNVMGLREGDNVVTRGMPVGKVKALLLEEDGVQVVALLHKPLNLRQDYRVEVVLSSVLGGRYLQIEEGSPGAPPLDAGAEVMGQRPRDLVSEATALVADFKEIADKIKQGEGTLGKLVTDDSLYTEARDVVAEIKSSVKEGGLLKNLEESAANIKDISEKINKGDGLLGKLVNDEELYEEAKRVMRDARATLNDLRETAPIVTFTSIFFGVF